MLCPTEEWGSEAMYGVGTYILRTQVVADGVVGFHSYPSCGDQLRDDVSHNPKETLLVELSRNLHPLPVKGLPWLAGLCDIS